MTITAAVLTVSDRASTGEYEDKSGPLLAQLLEEGLGAKGLVIKHRDVVPDEQDQIEKIFRYYADESGVNLVISTGGTGFSPRDVTPEATKNVIEREAPGFVSAMIAESLKVTPFAILSRPAAGIRKRTIIVNLPGSPKAVKENLAAIIRPIPHAVSLLTQEGVQKCNPPPAAAAPAAAAVSSSSSSSSSSVPTQFTKVGCGCSHEDKSSSSTENSQVSRGFRRRESPWPMLEVPDAQKIVRDHSNILPLQKIDAKLALGHTLAADVKAITPHPPFRASIKDGYAVHSSDGPGNYEVVSVSTAGGEKLGELPPGTICRINTGAALPPGADAVVQVENTELVELNEQKEEKIVKILTKVEKNHDVRPIGVDIAEGEVVLQKGDVIGAPEIGILAMVNCGEVEVYKVPTVCLVSTGDELLDWAASNKEREHSQIMDSNRPMLKAAIKKHSPHSKIIDGGMIPDDLGALRKKFQEYLKTGVDVVVSSGGVSMGEKDYLHTILNEMGTIHFGRMKMKPGKPTTFATIPRPGSDYPLLVFSLPGNPVSSMVTFELLTSLSLSLLSGKADPHHKIEATLAHPIPLDPFRPEYHRATIQWDFSKHCYIAVSTGIQDSSRLTSFRNATALLLLPNQKGVVPEGTTVPAFIL